MKVLIVMEIKIIVFVHKFELFKVEYESASDMFTRFTDITFPKSTLKNAHSSGDGDKAITCTYTGMG